MSLLELRHWPHTHVSITMLSNQRTAQQPEPHLLWDLWEGLEPELLELLVFCQEGGLVSRACSIERPGVSPGRERHATVR